MQHFIPKSDLTSEQIHKLLDLAIKLNVEYFDGGNLPVLMGLILAIFSQHR
jgi:hypothetical protein